MAVNNVAGHSRFRPNAFICADPPSKFHDGILRDSSIMKFVPTPKLHKRRGRVRTKINGEFKDWEKDGKYKQSILDCPNVWGFERRSWLEPDTSFFTDPGAAWGNLNVGVERTGQPKTVCTLLLGLRLLYYLGARRIFLVGVDFHMDSTKDILDNYSFGEERDENACRSNNAQYQIVNKWLCDLQTNGVFKQFGLEIYNCNENSKLRAFSYVPFDTAIDNIREGIPKEPYDCRNWYSK
jgi:hypothetical protein